MRALPPTQCPHPHGDAARPGLLQGAGSHRQEVADGLSQFLCISASSLRLQSPNGTEKFKTCTAGGCPLPRDVHEKQPQGLSTAPRLPELFSPSAGGDEHGLFIAAPGFLPALLVPAFPWPLARGKRLKRANAPGSSRRNKEPLVPGSQGKVQSRLPRLVLFSFSFSHSVFLWVWVGFGFLKTSLQEQSSDLNKSRRSARLLLCQAWGGRR